MMNKPYILLVEDDVDLCWMYIDSLLHGGYEVKAVTSGTEALSALRGRRPDAILTEAMLLGEGGIELIEFVRENKNLAQLPIVVFGSTTKEYFQQASLAGATKVISQPDSSRTLSIEIQQVLPGNTSH